MTAKEWYLENIDYFQTKPTAKIVREIIHLFPEYKGRFDTLRRLLDTYNYEAGFDKRTLKENKLNNFKIAKKYAEKYPDKGNYILAALIVNNEGGSVTRWAGYLQYYRETGDVLGKLF